MATLQDLQQLFAARKPHDVAIEISGFTGFRTTCIEDLSQDEINRLYACHAPRLKNIDEEFDAFKTELIIKAWRSKVLAAAERAELKEAGSFHRFNNWMIQRSKFKKALNSHNIDELKELHRQINSVLTNNRKSAQKPMTKAWWNQGEKLKNLN